LDWDDAKNAKLRAQRGIGFEDIIFHIERGDLLDILEHPSPDRYAGHRIFVVPARGLRVPRAVCQRRTDGLPDDDHPQPEGDETVLGRGVGR
jgi:hypothetical protein